MKTEPRKERFATKIIKKILTSVSSAVCREGGRWMGKGKKKEDFSCKIRKFEVEKVQDYKRQVHYSQSNTSAGSIDVF